ncbi:uncharacterized protein LOC131165369 [Malania oleifera]|uniref:uncharacterized protein LOC131165369 n=1 Tax=Malania oleifera TaxID=397392 RepID=UPI0025AEA9EE|nr:uncharacterized protein LOC131165369 [Malania oleifera]
MRCKKHFPDLSSAVGVCASCLRERLLALIAAQARAQVQAQAQAQAHSSGAAEDCRKSDPQPPPLVFPRSVSPYISRRKSDSASWHHQHPHCFSDQRFYSTPQVGPTYRSAAGAGGGIASFGKKKLGKFSLFSNIFRSRSDKSESEPRVSSDSGASASSSPNWFSSVVRRRQKKQSGIFTLEDSLGGGRFPCRARDRGMSPDNAGHCEDCEESPTPSGYSSEVWKTPMNAPAGARRGLSGPNRNVSGLAFCWSPLVRASPSRQWNQKGMQPEAGFSGEIRAPNKPHLSAAASYCANRSRKLADFGRSNHNH